MEQVTDRNSKKEYRAALAWRHRFKGIELAPLPLFAVWLWIVSLRGVDLRLMDDMGLISVLPPVIFVALGLLTASFCLALDKNRFSPPVILLHLLCLIFMLYGAAPLVEGLPRTAIVWRLTGIMDYVIQHGSVDPTIDAFHNWPGFFILAAFVSEVLGLASPLLLATWASVFLNLLYLGPLVMIFRTGSGDHRLVWLAVWFFYLANWIGQDYLSPQGFNYFLFLVILGVLLRWFKITPAQPELFFISWIKRLPVISRLVKIAASSFEHAKISDEPSRSWQRVGLLTLVVVLFAIIVPGHQLTPVATIVVVTTLVLFDRLTPRGLPLLMVVLTGVWISYMTVPYLSGHIEKLTGPIGALSENVSANLGGRFRGSPDHLFILLIRIVMTLFLWVLAYYGGIRRHWNGYRDWSFLLSALAPFSLLVFQPYGGELLLRVYLFTLPFMVFFAAALFYPTPHAGASWWTTVLVGLLSLALAISFFFTRYGNERMDYFSPSEVAAIEYVYQIAEPGSLLITGNQTLPWRFQYYDAHRYMTVERIARNSEIEELIEIMREDRFPVAYLILTRSQAAAAELFLGWPPEAWERFEDELSASQDLKTIFETEDARVYVLASDPE